jgi:hypothetical protein
MPGVDGPLVRGPRGGLVVAGKVQVRELDQDLASQPRITRVDGAPVDRQRGIVILDDHVQDLGQVEHGVPVPGIDRFLIRSTGAIRRVPVQEVAQIDQRLVFPGVGVPPVEASDYLDRGCCQPWISFQDSVHVPGQRGQRYFAIRVGDEISQRRRKLARIMLGAEEQSQQTAARSFRSEAAGLSAFSGPKNLRTPDAYCRCDEWPDLFG